MWKEGVRIYDTPGVSNNFPNFLKNVFLVLIARRQLLSFSLSKLN